MATQVTLNSGAVSSAGSLKLQTNGTTDAVIIDTAQNLGIGVTPSAWGGSFKALQISGSAVSASGTASSLTLNAYYNGTNWIRLNNSYGAMQYSQDQYYGHSWSIAGSGSGNIAFTQAMTLDASGNLLVNRTSGYNSGTYQSQKVKITGGIGINSDPADLTSRLTLLGDSSTGNGTIDWSNGFSLIFSGNGTERARIDSSGNLLVGTTATDSGAKTRIVYGSSQNGLQIKDSADTSNTAFVIFQNGSNSNIGTISRVGTTNVVAYNTTSDARLKNDLGIATSDSVIDALLIHDFTWKTDGTVDRGVFAQEAALIKPLAVREGSDEVDENGIPKNPWGVDYSKFVPDLIVYVKQLKQQIQSLETRLAVLENK